VINNLASKPTESAQYATDSQPTIVYTVSTIFGCTVYNCTPVASLCQPIFLFASTRSRFPAGCPQIGSSSMPTRPRRCDVRRHIGSCSFLAVLSRSLVRPLSQSTLSVTWVVGVFIDNSAATHDRRTVSRCFAAL